MKEIICTDCGNKMIKCYGKFGTFYKCNSCNITINAEDENKKCPKCGAFLIKRKNRSSQKYFFACSNFPKCNYTESYKEE